MYRAALVVVVALVAAVFSSSCREEQLTEQRVVSLLDSLDHKLVWLEYRLNSERWDALTTGKSDSLEFFERLYNYVITDRQNYDRLQQGEKLLSDKVDQRRAELILSRMQLGQIESHPEVIALRRAIGNPVIHAGGLISGLPLLDSSQSGRPGSGYVGRLHVDPQLSDAMGRLIRLRNQLARRERFNNYYALSMNSQGLDVDGHLRLLNRLEEASRPHYRQFLDSLAAQRGVTALSIQDVSLLIAGQGSSGAWSNFPADSEYVLVKESLAAIGFDLERLPIYFADTEAGDSTSLIQCIAVRPPSDVRVYGYRPGRPHEYLHQVGRALHWTHVGDDRPLFNSVLSPIWSEGVSRVFAYLADEPVWLEEYAHASALSIERHRRERAGVETARLRWTLMHLMFEYEAYTNPDRDLNRVYW